MRLSYKTEVRQLRQELILVHTQRAAMEELFIAKQEKINRLIGYIERLTALGFKFEIEVPQDMRREQVIESQEQLIAEASMEFESRMHHYEMTGERHSLRSRPLRASEVSTFDADEPDFSEGEDDEETGPDGGDEPRG